MIAKLGVLRSVAWNVGTPEEVQALEFYSPPPNLELELYGANDLSAYQETGQKEPLVILRQVGEEQHLGFFRLSDLEMLVGLLRG